MSRIGAWLRGSAKPSASAQNEPFNTADEAKQLEDALAAASLIMDDDIEGAERYFKAGKSSFHTLGSGVTIFMRALLGFEAEIMREASERLTEAEATAWADMKRAQKDAAAAYHSNIYPPGSEFALAHAESQLMSAVVAVLNENITESIKGFFKLRKAFITLDGIMEIEHRYMRQKEGLSGSSKTSLSTQKEEKHMPGGFEDDPFVEAGSARNSKNASSTKLVDEVTNQRAPANGVSTPAQDDDSDLDFVDADEAHSGAQTPANYLGHVATDEKVEEQLNGISLSKDDTPETSESETLKDPVTPKRRRLLNYSVDADVLSNPIDVFVHSGTNLCYGLINLILSMVPPAFGKLLAIIGFKGDRDRGIRMLWQSSKFSNINGAVAGLVLLGYYNG